MAIGQGDLFATPLQMASVAQTIGNAGVRLEPHIMAKSVDPDGRTVEEVEPRGGRTGDLAPDGARPDG